jgi:hypothetical protein
LDGGCGSGQTTAACGSSKFRISQIVQGDKN